ncbi:MAG: NUDIX hydrolase [Candidatus Obscuribacterales bacterium]|nr:NUDIX hydrolase [Candidatus Obscuribacterales bacterium]
MESNVIRPWKKIQSEQIADCRVFTVHKKLSQRTSANSERTHDFYVFDSGDWVNIIPVTANGEVILIEQFRHGTEGFTLEIPGGSVDREDPSPQYAAERELLEETGYMAHRWVPLGQSHPNPAIQGNLCHTFLALDVRQIEVPEFSGTEEIAIRLVPLSEIPDLIRQGTITHALVMVAFYWLQLSEDILNREFNLIGFRPGLN